MIRLLQHSTLIIAFLGVTLVQKVDWEWRVAPSPGPPAQCVEIVLPPLPTREAWLPKRVDPITVSSRPPLLHRFEITWYTNEQGWPPGSDMTASGERTTYGIVACPMAFALRTRFIILMPWGQEEFICLDRFGNPARWGLDVWLPLGEQVGKWHGEHWAIVLFDNRPLKEYGLDIEERISDD